MKIRITVELTCSGCATVEPLEARVERFSYEHIANVVTQLAGALHKSSWRKLTDPLGPRGSGQDEEGETYLCEMCVARLQGVTLQ